jgi:hypothetical protein
MASPVYRHIEFCTSPETLWGKLKSGNWDWLGVKPDDRTLVVGSPRRPAMTGSLSLQVHRGSGESRYAVRETDPLIQPPTVIRYESEAEAREAYAQRVDAAYSDGDEPQVMKVELLVESEIVDSEFVVRLGSTYR